jgi:hypothetical protein
VFSVRRFIEGASAKAGALFLVELTADDIADLAELAGKPDEVVRRP